MRVINKTFTGFICGQYLAPNGECHSGVMFYEDGVQTTLFACVDANVRKLYKALKDLLPEAADLTTKIFRIN